MLIADNEIDTQLIIDGIEALFWSECRVLPFFSAEEGNGPVPGVSGNAEFELKFPNNFTLPDSCPSSHDAQKHLDKRILRSLPG
jgi:hypothetical protein